MVKMRHESSGAKPASMPWHGGPTQALTTLEALLAGATANGDVAAILAGLSIAQKVALRDDGRMNLQIERKNQHEES
jgi:hypothetical protein